MFAHQYRWARRNERTVYQGDCTVLHQTSQSNPHAGRITALHCCRASIQRTRNQEQPQHCIHAAATDTLQSAPIRRGRPRRTPTVVADARGGEPTRPWVCSLPGDDGGPGWAYCLRLRSGNYCAPASTSRRHWMRTNEHGAASVHAHAVGGELLLQQKLLAPEVSACMVSLATLDKNS